MRPRLQQRTRIPAQDFLPADSPRAGTLPANPPASPPPLTLRPLPVPDDFLPQPTTRAFATPPPEPPSAVGNPPSAIDGPSSTVDGPPSVWWGLIGAVTAYVLEQQRRREEEEARQAAAAAAFNANQRAMDAAGLSTKHHLPVIEYDGPPPAADPPAKQPGVSGGAKPVPAPSAKPPSVSAKPAPAPAAQQPRAQGGAKPAPAPSAKQPGVSGGAKPAATPPAKQPGVSGGAKPAAASSTQQPAAPPPGLPPDYYWAWQYGGPVAQAWIEEKQRDASAQAQAQQSGQSLSVPSLGGSSILQPGNGASLPGAILTLPDWLTDPLQILLPGQPPTALRAAPAPAGLWTSRPSGLLVPNSSNLGLVRTGGVTVFSTDHPSQPYYTANHSNNFPSFTTGSIWHSPICDEDILCYDGHRRYQGLITQASHPMYVNRSALSVNGERVYNHYILIWNNRHHWIWDIFGKDGQLDIWEYSSVIWARELWSIGSDPQHISNEYPLAVEAIVRVV